MVEMFHNAALIWIVSAAAKMAMAKADHTKEEI